MKINCIIVDDEPVACELLVKYISDVPALELVGVCHSAFEATEVMVQQEVHLIFLDINMPLLTGMKFYRSLANPPAVIFTTAYAEFAIEGFEVDAVDYLLKPFSFERFYQAVSKMIERSKKDLSKPEKDFILLRSDKKLHRVNIFDIYCIEGLGDYLKVHLQGKFLVVHDTMINFLESLPETFVRVHKSWVVSVPHIRYIEGNSIKMNEFEIPIGLKYKEDLMNTLSKGGALSSS
jgi:DNA-binding LytR/AlgR family response regulator